VALVHVELKRKKTTNAQLGFFESFSKLLQTFVALENQTKEDYARHNSGGVRRALIVKHIWMINLARTIIPIA